MYTSDTSAEQVAARAAEIVIEQKARLETWIQTHSPAEGLDFYTQTHEVEVSAKILDLMSAYAELKGLIKPGQVLRSSKKIRG